MPRLSVVMPAYNCGRYIGQAIDSVLDQTEADLELIVVDDGSTDDTPALVQIAAAADPRVRVVRQPNSGKPAIARNRGIREARGDVLCFLDADDVWWPDKLQIGLRILQEHPDVDLVFHDVEYMGEDGSLSGRRCLRGTDFSERVLATSRRLGGAAFLCDAKALFFFICTKVTTIFPSAAMIRRTRLLQEPVFFAEDVVTGEDADLWFRLVKSGGIACVDAALSGYRIHDQGVARRCSRDEVDPVLVLVRNYRNCQGVLDRCQMRAYRRRIAADLRTFGWRRATEGRHAEAWRFYWRSLRWQCAGSALKGLVKSSVSGFLRGSG